jgi:hypothetical protein
VEGEKEWSLYPSLSEEGVLPRCALSLSLTHTHTLFSVIITRQIFIFRYSSEDYDDVVIGDPFLTDVIAAGDLCYLPRGVIHQV